MSELRQNLLTGNWTVIAPERGDRPEQSLRPEHPAREDHQDHDNTCPFCPDNEGRFPLEKINEISDVGNNWLVRTIENKYKIFDHFVTCPINPEPFKTQGIYSCYEGCGNHWLVIENRSHNKLLGEMEVSEISNVLISYLKACHSMEKNPNNLITIIFKNQGLNAGASQPHAHSQIVGSRVVPIWIRNALHVQERHFDHHGSCVMCDIVAYEKKMQERIIFETEHIIALSPYAASSPYEVWIVPKRHFACYVDIDDSEVLDTALSIRKILGAYITRLNNPDFNYFIHNAPFPLAGIPYYHMYIQIVPRIQTMGGFEIGTMIPVNSVLPEAATRLLS